jgi:hypothetical protein
MVDFLKMPEALNHIAGQAWLSPDEPPILPKSRLPSKRLRLGWREGLRQIAEIVGRI